MTSRKCEGLRESRVGDPSIATSHSTGHAQPGSEDSEKTPMPGSNATSQRDAATLR
jgi:hypothetical protein